MQALCDSCCTECDSNLGRILGFPLGGNKNQLVQHQQIWNILSKLAWVENCFRFWHRTFPNKGQILKRISQSTELSFSTLKHEFFIVVIMTQYIKCVLSWFTMYCYFLFLVKEVVDSNKFYHFKNWGRIYIILQIIGVLMTNHMRWLGVLQLASIVNVSCCSCSCYSCYYWCDSNEVFCYFLMCLGGNHNQVRVERKQAGPLRNFLYALQQGCVCATPLLGRCWVGKLEKREVAYCWGRIRRTVDIWLSLKKAEI